MEQSQNFFARSVALARQLFSAQMAPLLVLFAVGTLFTLQVEDFMQALSGADLDNRWMYQISLGLWDLFEGVALILILSWGIPKVRDLTEAHFQQHPFQDNYLNSFLAEYLRLLANVLLWGLLLIIPGFLRYCRLIFVPYVALFARPYREGKVDALDLAAQLTKGRYKWILLLLLSTTAVQVGIEFLPHLRPELHTLPLRILSAGISFLISIWLYANLYLRFEQAMEEHKWN